jgi:ankyrin repeat protein
VFCQLVYLRRCIPGRIRRALDELPETLDETYARSLEEIDEQNREYAHRLFQCVAAASRPFLVSELAEFLAFDFEAGPTPTFLADWRPEDPTHAVISMCSSLLAVVKPDSGSPVVQFAHFTVKEYLTSARLAKTTATISRFHISMTAAHTIVAQACLCVLLHLDQSITKDSLEEFPLAKYAAEHWVGHARFKDESSEVQDGMKRLFDPSEGHLSAWVHIYDPEDSHTRIRFERPVEAKARATALHYAAFCGIHDAAALLIVEHSQDINARGFNDEETPLHVASRCGHADVAQLLLEHGADGNARDDSKRTPLLRASEYGHVEVARVLLKHGVDAEARCRVFWGWFQGWRPLELASYGGHVEVVQVLLEHGADVKARDDYNCSALHYAQGEEVAQFLLKHGADASALDSNGRLPLHKASREGRIGAVRALLEYGGDANARDAKNATPLHLASEGGEPDVARLLLQYGSDIHARDDMGRTPFMTAFANDESKVMDFLLEHGAEDHRNTEGGDNVERTLVEEVFHGINVLFGL